MCGIAGAMSSVLSVGEVNTFKDLLNISSVRGYQGSGAIVVSERDKRMDVKAIRSQMISGWLAYSDNLAALLDKQPSVLIGHARWPTKGGTDKSALHPHRIKNICGVHNGTLFMVNDTKIEEGQSDSKALFTHIQAVGIEEAWAKKTGAAAIVYVNEEDQTVNFIRNSQRPLHFKNIGWQKNISTLYWGSTEEILNFGVGINFRGANVWDTYLPPDKLYSYPLDVEHRIIPTAVRDFTPKTSVGYRSHGGRFSSGWAYGDWDTVVEEAEKGTAPTETALAASILNAQRAVVPMMDRQQVNVNRAAPVTRTEDSTPPGIRARALEVRNQQLLKRTHYVDGLGISRPIPAGFHLEWDITKAGQKLVPDKEENGLPRPSFLTPFDDKDHRDAEAYAATGCETTGKTKARILRITGRSCIWCGDPTETGQTVFKVHHSFNRDDILCQGCAENPDCVPFLGKNPESVTIGN